MRVNLKEEIHTATLIKMDTMHVITMLVEIRLIVVCSERVPECFNWNIIEVMLDVSGAFDQRCKLRICTSP